MGGDGELRLVCVGDSFTEGMSDERRPDGEYRGWADRTAEALARRHADADAAAGTGTGTGTGTVVRYANLAVRGKVLDQVVAEQLGPALRLSPTLTTFHAGPNDVLRRGTDLADLCRRYDTAVARVVEGSEDVLLFTSIGRAGGQGRLAAWLAARFSHFNDNVREVASRRGALLVDLEPVDVLTDRRLWDLDRLHLDADGHARVAAAVLEALGVDRPGLLGGEPGWWREPLPEASTVARHVALAADVVWARRHLVPWLGRRLTGRSSGDGRVAKDPALRVVAAGG